MPRHKLKLNWLQERDSVGALRRMTAAASILLLAITLTALYLLEMQNSTLNEEIGRVQRSIEQRSRIISTRNGANDADKHSVANQSVAQHNELVELLEALEQVALSKISIDSIALHPEGKSYRVELRTPDLEAARHYVATLNNAKKSQRMWRIVSIEAQRQSAEWLILLEMQ